MIQYNHEYTFSRGNGKITFAEGKNNTITATYKVFNDVGTITGKLNENVLEATFHSTSMNRVGLINFKFSADGFDAQWKNGLEPGSMRGKWFTEKNTSMKQEDNEDAFNSNIWNWSTISAFAVLSNPMDEEDYATLKDNAAAYIELLTELAEDGCLHGKKTNIKLFEVIQEAGRLFGKLAYLAEKNEDSHQYWCTKWASFNESIEMNCNLSFDEYLALGQQYHLQFQPAQDEYDDKNYPEEWFTRAYENAQNSEELLTLIQYGLFSEYHDFESLANDCIRKAWEFEKSIDVAVKLIADDNEEKRTFLDEDLFEEIVAAVRNMDDTEDGEWTKEKFEDLVDSF